MGVVEADKAMEGEGVERFGPASHLAVLLPIKKEQKKKKRLLVP